jgi:hypothetical protein
MTELQIYKFKSDIVSDFRVFAPNKHGTRFLSESNPIEKTHISISKSKDDFEINLTEALFDFLDNPKSTQAIKLKKIKILKKENVCFVYRNPYDAFVSSIQTGYASSGQHNGIEKLGANMTGNGHFYVHYYRVLESVLKDVESNTISFVELNDLTEFLRVQTLFPVSFSKEKYSFDDYITKEDVEVLCKKHHPILWHRFMIEIEKEKIALNNLIKKFDWKTQFYKEIKNL